jgi:hypothetical protein
MKFQGVLSQQEPEDPIRKGFHVLDTGSCSFNTAPLTPPPRVWSSRILSTFDHGMRESVRKSCTSPFSNINEGDVREASDRDVRVMHGPYTLIVRLMINPSATGIVLKLMVFETISIARDIVPRMQAALRRAIKVANANIGPRRTNTSSGICTYTGDTSCVRHMVGSPGT